MSKELDIDRMGIEGFMEHVGATAQRQAQPAQGVDPEPESPAIAQEVEAPTAEVTQAEPEPETQPVPVKPEKVNLDDLEEFRMWKSEADRRVAQAARQAEQERQQREAYEQQMTDLKRQLDQLRLRDAEPDEVAAYYEQQLAAVQAEQQRQQEQARQAQIMSDRAMRFLEGVGLTVDTPGLDWSGGATPEGLIALMESATGLVALRAQQMTKQQKADAEKAARTAEHKALQDAGVTKVNTATGGAPPTLQRQYEEDMAALRGTGNLDALLEVKDKYRRQGLKV